MSNRKRKSKRQRDAAIGTFGLKGDADRYETAPLHQQKFQQGDMAWLAKEYIEQHDAMPSLKLEDFAAQYGISADELRLYFPKPNHGVAHSVILWHGTSMLSARSIMTEGFRAGVHNKIFFARSPAVARRYALASGSGEADQPAVIMCSIDLWKYNRYEQRENGDFMFEHKRIGSEVIMQVTAAAKQRHGAKSKRKKDTGVDFFDIALSFNSGRTGIAYWLNNYLKLDGADRIYEEHATVKKIKEWLDEQMDAGRFGEVPADEILEQIGEYLPNQV